MMMLLIMIMIMMTMMSLRLRRTVILAGARLLRKILDRGRVRVNSNGVIMAMAIVTGFNSNSNGYK